MQERRQVATDGGIGSSPSNSTNWYTIAVGWLIDTTGTATVRYQHGQRRGDPLMRVAGYLHRQGCPPATITATVLELNARHVHPPISPQRFRGLTARIERRWQRGDAISDNATGTTRTKIAELRRAALAASWHGVREHTASKVLLALIDLAQRTGELSLTISTRRLGELAGCGHKAAHYARHHLAAAGWLKLERGGRQGCAPTYSLSGMRGNSKPPPSTYGGTVPFHPAADPLAADAWRWRRYGPTGWKLLQVLRAGGSYGTAAALARAAGLAADTVRHKVRRLAADGLVEHTAGGWSLGPVVPLPTYHDRDRDAVIHRAERVLHHDQLRDRGIRVAVVTPVVTLDELRAARATHRLVHDLELRGLLADDRRPTRLRMVEMDEPPRQAAASWRARR